MEERGPSKLPDTSPAPTQPVGPDAQPPTARVLRRAAPPAARMSKAQATSLAQSVKDWTLVASLTSFVVFGGLVISHNGGTAGQTGGGGDTQQINPFGQPGDSSSNQSGGGYFNQPGGFGLGRGGTQQAPVSGSHTS
jgi:hypothetical protein